MAKANPLQFAQQVRAEVSKVVWPTQRETLLTTGMVFVMVTLAAAFFSVADLIIRYALDTILRLAS
ncbi:preprotein translocase subunit SecE [Rhodobacterales bacterium 52_120_T64]|nr:preprotein translocase subunit SecE [Rhodobacterales bacterium 52_120_T64]